MDTKNDPERLAWQWLLNLPRLEIDGTKPRATWEQIIVKIFPGRLYQTNNAPFISLSIHYPGLKRRVRGTGNSLMEAVRDIHLQLWIQGIQTPFPEFPGGIYKEGIYTFTTEGTLDTAEGK